MNLRQYLIRRLLLIIPTFLGITLITFMVIQLSPGNPAAMMVTFYMLVRPALQRLAGAAGNDPTRFQVTAGFSHKKKAGRTEFVRAALARDGAGLQAVKYPHAGAGILRSLVESDGLVELPDEVTQITPGSQVQFIPFTELQR